MYNKVAEWSSALEFKYNNNEKLKGKAKINSVMRMINHCEALSLCDYQKLSLSNAKNTLSAAIESRGLIDCEDLMIIAKALRTSLSAFTEESKSLSNDVVQEVESSLLALTKTKYLAVLDLEMTCTLTDPEFKKETLEFGCVIVETKSCKIVGKFQQLVTPIINPELTPFCTALTTIQQSMLDGAPTFKFAMQSFSNFLNEFDKDMLILTYGGGDVSQLQRDCTLHQIDYSDLVKCDWYNVKKAFAHTKSSNKHCGLKKALKTAGVERHGISHRALNDAIDTAGLIHYIVAKLKNRLG